MSEPLKPTDPAYWMLEQGLRDPSKRTVVKVYLRSCYICRDPEFALMGLPLCKPCVICGGHVAADDERCDGCGANQFDAEHLLGLISDEQYRLCRGDAFDELSPLYEVKL